MSSIKIISCQYIYKPYYEVIFISKQLACQKFIFKIHSSRLRRENWSLSLPLEEARKNDEVISLADSQVLRWIDELNGITDADEKAKNIKTNIKQIKKEPNSAQNKRKIRRLYKELDKLQFKPDYMCLIIDEPKDYYRACKGFSINGISYRRLLGTNGGVKNSTIVFVSERLVGEIGRRIDNDRDMSKEFVPAKLETYKGLSCSASNPVSMPNGILVVNDAKTEFLSDIIFLTDECSGEPQMELRKNQTINLDASDGFGLMSPSIAERWSRELGLDYVVSGLNTRYAFEKGMLFTFDFVEFAENVAHQFIVKDAWGNDVDIRNVEVILTTSMLKLWDSYSSIDDYISKSIRNGYTFAVTKVCPELLENERNLNYQFIQSYDLDDEDIEELIAPTINEIKDVLGGDWRKAVLFLKGSGLNEKNVRRLGNDYCKAMMIDHSIIEDPYIQSNIYQLIKNRIDEAKTGVVKVHGNYSIVSGDPYLLCQSIFGLEKTGLLSAGEIYNQYWADMGSEKLACFRAPMSCYENIRLVHPVDNEEVRHWYKYMKTCTILNGWDTTMAALNGCDFDGDLVMLTDNSVLVRRLYPTPALCCTQRKAEKKIATEEDFVKSNISSFGNEIGSITNRITSMYEVRSGFDKNSKEYKILSYRIQCGELFQQNSIDKSKGIIAKPMPKDWYDWHAINKIEDDEKRDLYKKIIADKKPYFMRYIYPALNKQYNTYIQNSNKNAIRKFNMSIRELEERKYSELSDEELQFLKYFNMFMPVGVGKCVMNKICLKFENEFKNLIKRISDESSFDYRVMKSKAQYTELQYKSIKKLYESYNERLRKYRANLKIERLDNYDSLQALIDLESEFRKECSSICPNEDVLCNIVLDITYAKNSTKKFAWAMCGDVIIKNLLKANNNTIQYPSLNKDGDLIYGGNKYMVEQIELEESDDSIE